MALVLNDRVRETTAVTGTGSATLLGAVTGYQSFSTIGNGNTTYYTIADQGGPNWEVGLGTYSSGTLARTTVLSSSNSGSLVNFTAGTKDVFVTQPSEKAVYLDGSGNITPSSVGPLTVSSLTDSGLTSGRVTYAGTAGLLQDSANLTFDGSTLTTLNAAYTGTLTGGTGVVNLGSGQFYKDASGNIGVGTSSPAYKLQVAGATPTIAINDTTASASSVSTLLYRNIDGNGNTYNIASIAGASAGNGGYGNLVFSTMFNNSNTEQMRITYTGDVVIGGTGITSPAKLQINSPLTTELVDSFIGAPEAYNPSTYSAKNAYMTSGTQQSWATTANGAVTAANLIDINAYNGTGANNVYFGAVAGGSPNGSANFVFGRRSAAQSWAETMRIDIYGNVGVGTTTPSSFVGTNGGLVVYASDNIGWFEGNATYGATTTFSNNSATGNTNLAFRNNGTTNFYLQSLGTTRAFRIYDNVAAAERMRIDSAGNVGIGTASPAYQLQVGNLGSGAVPKIYVPATYGPEGVWIGPASANGGAQIELASHSTSTTDYSWKIAHDSDTYGANALVFANTASASSTYAGFSYTERMRINSSGYVGIGTPSPAIPLAVTGMSNIGNVFSGLVKNSLNNANAFVAIGQLGVGAGIIFSGFVYTGSYTGNCQINVQVVTDYTNDNVAYQVISTGYAAIGSQTKTSIQLVKATVGGISYLGFLKNGGGTGNMYLNAFIQAGVGYPFETASGSFTVTSTIATLN